MTRNELIERYAANERDFRGEDLSGADLNMADLSGSDLNGSDLSWTNLRGSDLSWTNLRRTNLSWASLSRADLSGSDLSWANLSGSNLRGADLSWSNLRWTNLSWADLCRAELRGANLEGIVVNWQSHDLIAEILIRAAGEDAEKRSLAGSILASRDWCWEQFLTIEHPQREWALAELSKWVRDGDNAPEVLRAARGES